MKIGVVIPALNEEAVLAETLRHLGDAAVVVADGGSRDSTLEIARAAGALTLVERGGRGAQQNAGAAALGDADVLLFLHADAALPQDWKRHVEVAMAGGAILGAFRLSIDRATRPERLIAAAANMRSQWFSLPYGDQALFLRRETFEELGGFRPLPIMEDFDIVRRARKLGRIVLAPALVTVSPRRWRTRGTLRTTIINQLVLAGWAFGLAPDRLAAFYRRSR